MAFITAMVVFLAAGSAKAVCYPTAAEIPTGVATVSISGSIFTGAMDPITSLPKPPPGAGAITGAKVMVQNMHHGGPFECYAAVTGSTYEAFVPVPATGKNEYVVMFTAANHGLTSREFTVLPGATAPMIQDAALPPVDHLTGESPRGNMLLYAFVDKYVNGEDDYPDDPALSGFTFYIFDENGKYETQGTTGTQTMAEMPVGAGPDINGLYYFKGLKPGEHKIMGLPANVSPDFDVNGDPLMDCHISPTRADSGNGWFWAATEEGTQCWGAVLRPNDPGTILGAYLAWFAMIPNIGQMPAPAAGPGGIIPPTSTVSGTLWDADGTDPLEVLDPLEVPQICNYDVQGELCVSYDTGFHPGDGQRGSYYNYTDHGVFSAVTPAPTNPVEDCVWANNTMPNGFVVLWDQNGLPNDTILATALAGTDGTYSFQNVPPGNYKIFSVDTRNDYVWEETQLTVQPNIDLPNVDLIIPRFFARANGYIIDDTPAGAPVPAPAAMPGLDLSPPVNMNGVKVDIRLTDGSVWKHSIAAVGSSTAEGETPRDGFFNFDELPEVEVMAHLSVDLTSLPITYRGTMTNECFPDPASTPLAPLPDICENYDLSNRDIGWFTGNYRTNLHIERIPAGVGEIIGSVYNDHLTFDPTDGVMKGNGYLDEGEDKLLTGVTVNLRDAFTHAIVATTTTGVYEEARAGRQGHIAAYTPKAFIPSDEFCPLGIGPNSGLMIYLKGDLEVDEWGGIYKGPRFGQYEFRDVAPGSYIVEAVLPAGFSASPATSDSRTITVTGGLRNDVNFGASTQVALAGEIEGGVFDDVNIDLFHQSILWLEKQGIPHLPVGIYDYLGYKLGAGEMGHPRCYAAQPPASLWDPVALPGVAVGPCPAGEDFPQNPEVERRSAPGVHIYMANDLTLPGYRADFAPLALNYEFGQGKFKFEADWSLLPLTPVPAVLGVGEAPALPVNPPVIVGGAPQAMNYGPYGSFRNAVYTASDSLNVQLTGGNMNWKNNKKIRRYAKKHPGMKKYLKKHGMTKLARQCLTGISNNATVKKEMATANNNPYVLTGINFGAAQGNSTVSLSGQKLKVVSWSDTSITVNIPVNAIPGPMIVATTNGPSNSTFIDLATIGATAQWTADLAAHSVYVDASASVGSGDGSKTAPYATITEALNNLPTVRPAYVMVAPGSYNENVHITSSDIQIIGSGPFESMMDGIVVENMNPIGITSSGSFTGSGGAVFFIGQGGMSGAVNNIMISGFTITGGSTGANGVGGGIFADYGNRNIDINNNIISRNGAEYGGAIWLHKSNHDVRIWSNLISENGNFGGYSGGISVNDEPEYGTPDTYGAYDHYEDDALNTTPPGTYEIFNNLIYRNYSPDYGGGMVFYEVKDHLKIYGNMVLENRSDDHGGGIFFEDSGPVDLYDNVFMRNFATDDGGAVSFEDVGDNISIVNIYNNLFAENIADDKSENSARGGALSFDDTLHASVYNNTITGNIVAGTFDPVGGAIDSERHGHEYDINSPAPQWPYFSDVKIYNNIIWNNWRLFYTIAAGEDLDYRQGQNYQWSLDNIHVDNPALNQAWHTDYNSDTMMIKEFNIINGVVNDPNQPGRQHNIDADPLFVNAAAQNWHLQSTSPAIGTAKFVNAPPYDLDFLFRGTDCAADMGALEYRTSPAEVISIPTDLLGTVEMPLPGSSRLSDRPAPPAPLP